VTAIPAALWSRHRARNGPPPDERHLSECTPQDEYRRWIAKHEPDAAELKRQSGFKFSRSPKISIVVPVYNPPAEYLTAMIESVKAQTYGNWELCLADASPKDYVRPILETAAASDLRIRVNFLESNCGIVGNSNAAAALATGDFIGLLDHDDTLAPFALHEVVAALNENPDADFLYSDEDKLDMHGDRVEPNFKPDWSPETLRSRNYICHFTVLKKPLFESIANRPGRSCTFHTCSITGECTPRPRRSPKAPRTTLTTPARGPSRSICRALASMPPFTTARFSARTRLSITCGRSLRSAS
jgi:hypothetical protein